MQVKKVKIEVDAEKAISQVDELKTGVKETDEATIGAESGFKKLTGGIGAAGLAFKALGIGLIVSAFVKLKDLLGQNQVVMDTVTQATESLNFIFQQVIQKAVELGQSMTKAFTDPKQAILNLWQSIKQNIADRVEGLIDTFGALGKVIKSAFSRDLEGLKEGLADAKTGFVQLATGMTEVEQTNFVENLKEQTEQLKENIQSAKDYGKAVTALRNQVKIAEATQRGLILEYQREAELQRQVRDDISLTIEERIEANNKLADILDEQFIKEQELAHKKVALAELELSSNQDNVDLQVALINAKNELADLDERITGQRSEQLTNLNALQEEYNDSIKETAVVAKKTGKADVEITKLTNDEKADIIAGALGNIAGALGENSKSAKGLAVAQALIDTYAGATKALAQGGIFGTVAAAGIVAAGLGNVKKIVSTKLPGVNDSSSPPTPDADIPTTSVGGIGGLVPNVEAISPPDISQQPVQAFVVENDISNSQALQEELEIQATL